MHEINHTFSTFYVVQRISSILVPVYSLSLRAAPEDSLLPFHFPLLLTIVLHDCIARLYCTIVLHDCIARLRLEHPAVIISRCTQDNPLSLVDRDVASYIVSLLHISIYNFPSSFFTKIAIKALKSVTKCNWCYNSVTILKLYINSHLSYN